jgi:methylglyoxal/glyoxal reductase
MPMFGLGCTQPGEEDDTRGAVIAALENGYRLIDTASVYENEADVGRGLRAAAIPRDDVFLATKVWNSDLGYDRTLAAFDRSLELLQVEYIDLYMIHFPLIRLRRESWRALGKLYEDGRCRAIGVSNFAIKHIDEIVDETGVLPAVNQVEFNPFLNQRRLHEWCRRKEILVQTHTPVSKQTRRRERRLSEIAGPYGKSPAQLLLRWALQKGVGVLVRSLDPQEIADRADIFDFEISLRDVDAMDSLHENLRVGWDPSSAP